MGSLAEKNVFTAATESAGLCGDETGNAIAAETMEPPEAISSRLEREPGLQRAMFEARHLLIILHQIPSGMKDVPGAFWMVCLSGGLMGLLLIALLKKRPHS